MLRRRYLVGGLSVVATAMLALAAIFAGGLGAAPRLAKAASSSGAVREVSSSFQHGVSPAARDLPAQATAFKGTPDRPLLSPALAAGPDQPDGALQTKAGAPLAATQGLGFGGMGLGAGDLAGFCNCAPPDPNLAVGATQVVQIVNTGFAVFNKTTGALAAGFPKAINTLWSNFGGGCQTNDDGDPIAQYDQINGRWIITQFSVSTTPFLQCVAVSTTSDATGTYNLYSFNYGNTQFNDYPKLGVWPDGYYITFNIFNNGQTFAGPKTCAWDAAAMRSGAASATQVCFQLGTSVASILPADMDGTIAPAAGTPNFQISLGSNALNFFKFHVDFVNTANSTYTGPTSIPVAAFTQACSGGTCVTQPGTNNKLDSLADRLMYRLAYRKLSNGQESLLVDHSVKVSGNNRSQVDGVRWYELRNPSAGTPTVFQQGTFSPDSTNRWMGSIAMDKLGNIGLGYSASSGSVAPSVRFTGRVPTDAAGTMEAEVVAKAGVGSQTGTLHRWGDYSAIQVDPSDDCTFWYTNEYLKASGSFNWSTWITSFKMPGC
ncbi:MAG TPA: hypothetical protein VLJ14_10570 [Ktedonobacterales bacterium]|jgi:hypothetical protein|nr:hypothetical protein [Ktedonobacterales bacterium]